VDAPWSGFRTLADALAAAARTGRGITHVAGESTERRVPYAELRERALALAGALAGRGLAPGGELVVAVADNETLLEAFWAAVLAGAVPVPLAPGANDDQRMKILRVMERLADPRLLIDAAALERLLGLARRRGLEDAAAGIAARAIPAEALGPPGRTAPAPAAGARAPAQSVPGDLAPERLAFVQFSSGSTSAPKGVALTHANLLANVRGIAASSGMRGRDTFLSWMPLSHDMGLIGFHLVPLVTGVDQHLLPTELFVRRPLLWLRAAARTRATLLCAPNFGYHHVLRVLKPDALAGLDLSAVRLLFNGAEPISLAVCESFLAAMAPYGLARRAMYPVYGLAEASLAVSFPKPGSGVRPVHVRRDRLGPGARVRPVPADAAGAVPFVRVGRPVRGCDVRISDPAGGAAGAGVVGAVQIRGANVTAGYYRDAAATAGAITADGWLDTGDLGFLSDGELVITGRAKDVLFVNGQNFYPQDLEAIALDEPGVEPGKVAACGVRHAGAPGDEVLVFLQHRGEPGALAPLARALRRRIGRATEIRVSHVVPVRRIPKTTSGKVQRYALGEAWLAGEFDEALAVLEALLVDEPEPDAGDAHDDAPERGGNGRAVLEAELKRMCDELMEERAGERAGERAAAGGLGVDENIFEAGTNSLTLALIYERIEERWPGQLDITDFFDHPTIRDLAAHLHARLADPAR